MNTGKKMEKNKQSKERKNTDGGYETQCNITGDGYKTKSEYWTYNVLYKRTKCAA